MRRAFLSGVIIAAVLAACSPAASRDPTVASAAADTGRVAVNGGSLYWEAAGTGAPVVLLHGGNLDRRMWDEQFALLQRGYRVIRYDARGFGKSTDADRAFRAPDDLAALLGALGVPKATLIGLSMGGGMAIDFALAYPAMVDRLVLASTSVSGGTWAPDADTLWLPAGRAAFARGDSIGLALAWLDSDYIRTAMHPPEQADRLRRILLDNAGHLMQRARDQSLERESSPPAAARLAELRMPILLLVGTADTPLILSMARAIADSAPHVQRVDFPGVGHMINLEASADFNRAVATFLTRR